MARGSTVMFAFVAAGCRWIAGLDDPIAGDGAAGASCFGSNLVEVCFSQTPSGTVQLPSSGSAISTTSCIDQDVTTNPSNACVIAASTVTLGTVSFSGTSPLVIVATDTITVDGVVDASSHEGGINGTSGPGADGSACGSGGAAGGAGGGGAGGSFIGAGGSGGAPEPGTPAATLPLAFHAGCRGERGGGAESAGTGGNGGGAIYLIAGNAIHITPAGAIFANGAGGTGGASNDTCASACGGGGGGTGGLVGLEAPAVTIDASARVCAVGGGGGPGNGSGTGDTGTSGKDAVACSPGLGGSAAGGIGGDANGGAGGDGAAGLGGGGGGGGVGAIAIFAADETIGSGATLSPSP